MHYTSIPRTTEQEPHTYEYTYYTRVIIHCISLLNCQIFVNNNSHPSHGYVYSSKRFPLQWIVTTHNQLLFIRTFSFCGADTLVWVCNPIIHAFCDLHQRLLIYYNIKGMFILFFFFTALCHMMLQWIQQLNDRHQLIIVCCNCI